MGLPSECIFPIASSRRAIIFRFLRPGRRIRLWTFSYLSALFINRADFSRDNKTWICCPFSCRIRNPIFLFQYIQAALCRFQLFLQLFSPGRVSKIPCPYNMDSLSSRPQIQIFRRAVFAGSAGISGMDMQICYVHKDSFFPLLLCHLL